MRVLVLSPYLPAMGDQGGRLRTRVLLAAAHRCGSVTLVVPASDEDGAARRRLQVELDVAVRAIPAPASVPRSPLRKLWCWAGRRSDVLTRRWNAASVAAVGELLRAASPDLLIVDSSFCLPLLSDEIPPLLLHLHNVESALLRRAPPATPFAERMVRAIEARAIAAAERRAARRSTLVITVSEPDAALVRVLAPAATVCVVENSVDLTHLPPLPAPPAGRAPVLLFVGTFDYPPNVAAVRELVLQHLPVLRQRFPDVRVRLVGRDPDGVAAELAAVPGVSATGRVDDVVPHYRDAVAVYVPLRAGGGTRIKVLEACALQRPVLATAVAVEGLALQPNVHFLRVETPADGVEALATVLAGDAAAMVRAARERIEERYGDAAAIDRLAATIRRHFS